MGKVLRAAAGVCGVCAEKVNKALPYARSRKERCFLQQWGTYGVLTVFEEYAIRDRITFPCMPRRLPEDHRSVSHVV